MAEKKPSNREQVKQIIAQIEGGIQELFQSEQYAEYLRTMSRFHSYSYRNTILIHAQMPHATQVAGYNKWKNQFGRQVKKGEKGLSIIAPTPYKKKIEEMKLDPETRTPVLDGNGNAVIEEREIEIPMFRLVKVFDVSQTEGRPLPSLTADLTGNVQHYEAFMEALRRVSPMPIVMANLEPGVDGRCNYTDQLITIQENMSEVATVRTGIHEITHAMLHDREHRRLTAAAGDETKEAPKPKDRSTREVEAESVAYTVCQYYGIETGEASLGYIATWSKDRSLPELKASLETISKAANALISDIDRHFVEVCKERGIDLTTQQPERDETVPTPDTLEQLAADMYDYMDRLHQAGVLEHPFTLDTREESIADLVAEMRAGNFEDVRGPLNYLVQHADSVEARTMLERLDKLMPAQDAPLEEQPDTPERFMGDMMDLMDRLYQAGLINRNFPPDNREQIKAEQVRTLRTNPTLARAVLEKFIREETGADEARALLDRLDGLIQAEKLAALEKEYVYKMEANPTTVGPPDSHLVQAYEKTPQGALKPDEVLFVSSADQCSRLLDGLNNGTIHYTDFFRVRAACVSHYTTKDGAELDALEDAEGKIYLGRRDHYDNRGHYMNYDDTLLHISDREKLFNLISGGGFSESQDDMLDGGYFSQEDYAEFDALRVGVLKQFDQTVELLFDGKPFQFIQPELSDIPRTDRQEQKYRYAVEYEGSIGQYLLAAYQKDSTQYGMALFTGTEAVCNDLLEKLHTGALHHDDFCKVIKANMSHYVTKDGTKLVALTDEDDKVYLGKRDHYDNWGHYLNNDHSLLHISDNERVFNLISGSGFSITQAEILDGGYYTQADFAEFEALQTGVLAQFEQVKPLLFAGEPFRPNPPEGKRSAPKAVTEALYLLDDATYLHIQASGSEWDYTLYDKASQRELDGGVMDGANIDIAKQKIFGFHALAPANVEIMPLDMVDTLRTAAEQSMQTAAGKVQEQQRERMEELREHFAQEDAALWDTTLDEYPVPNDALTLDDLIDGSDLLPLSMEQAAAFLEQDMTIYMVETGKEPAMLFDADELSEQHQGAMFAVPREEWEESQEFRQAVAERMRHQEEREQAFLDHGADCFAIYQVKLGDVKALHDIRYESLDWLKSIGRTVERENYDLVYTAPLSSADSADEALEQLWYRFNNEHPADFQHPSMSVSDIIALKRDGVVSCHYCDSVGFTKVPNFLPHKPTVAELEAQVKAGQQISLMDLADATHREERQKKSVVAQLKNQPRQKTNKTAPKKSAEKEI